ncbi:tyrosine phosphatase family protein [Methylobacillus glycogenes]|uniref:tyrosine phosphatase family protein n=1 Tax=Methylobacillus glycogenes TaxID=406 RepID=UPI000472DD39|nr:dual specificity protein phosphatase family protein [Methylobacillus glycogenes]
METTKFSICGIKELNQHTHTGATHVLSFVDPELQVIEGLDQIDCIEKSVFRFHDIIEPKQGYVLPTKSDMEKIIALGEKYMHLKAHVLLHCHQGVSRSTAVLIALFAQSQPELAEDELFAILRSYRKQAWPNSLMIQHFDDLLGKKGKLVKSLSRHYAFQIASRPAYLRLMRVLGRQKELEMGLAVEK